MMRGALLSIIELPLFLFSDNTTKVRMNAIIHNPHVTVVLY